MVYLIRLKTIATATATPTPKNNFLLLAGAAVTAATVVSALYNFGFVLLKLSDVPKIIFGFGVWVLVLSDSTNDSVCNKFTYCELSVDAENELCDPVIDVGLAVGIMII